MGRNDVTRTYRRRSNFFPPINNGLSIYRDMTYVSFDEGVVNLESIDTTSM